MTKEEFRRETLDFFSPAPFFDCALEMGGKDVYVNKKFLSLHSPYFNSLFYGGFREQDERRVKVEDVDSEEFVGLLTLLYYAEKPIASTAVQQLQLADRLQFLCLMDDLERIIFVSDHIKVSEKLRLCEEIRLPLVERGCIMYLESYDDGDRKEVENSGVLAELTAKKRAKIEAAIRKGKKKVDSDSDDDFLFGAAPRPRTRGAQSLMFKHTFTGLNKIKKSGELQSDEFDLAGFRWRLKVSDWHGGPTLILQCLHNSISSVWYCDVIVEMTYKHEKSGNVGVENKELTMTTFQWEKSFAHLERFLAASANDMGKPATSVYLKCKLTVNGPLEEFRARAFEKRSDTDIYEAHEEAMEKTNID